MSKGFTVYSSKTADSGLGVGGSGVQGFVFRVPA